MYLPKKIINYNDFIIFEQYVMNIDSINEANLISSLSKIVTDKSDVIKYINIITNKYYELTPDLRRKLLKAFIIVATSFFSITQIHSMISDKNIRSDIDDITKTEISKDINNDNSIDIFNASASDECKEHIMGDEKLRLNAYKIGDGMITIGYGHAKPIHKSKYKIGDKITKEKADNLFNADIKSAEDGIKRIFKQWKDDNIDIKITQGQFDAMVSMVYNMGISKFRQTNFIQELKDNNIENAAKLIKKTAVSDKFSGLHKRRDKEYKMFIKK